MPRTNPLTRTTTPAIPVREADVGTPGYCH